MMTHDEGELEYIPAPRFNKRKEFHERLMPELQRLLNLCTELGIPAFCAFRIEENDEGHATARAGSMGGLEGYPIEFVRFMEEDENRAVIREDYNEEDGTWNHTIHISNN